MRTSHLSSKRKNTQTNQRDAKSRKGRIGRVSDATIHRLLLEHAGRCAICNRWVATDPNFFLEGNYREVAHIIPASESGPRAGMEVVSSEYINSIANLLPLCFDDHQTVDGPHKADYPPERLRRIKAQHASTIRTLCDQASLQPSLVVKCQAHIGDTKVCVTPNAVAMALVGKRPYDSDGLLLDFTLNSGSETPEALKGRAADISGLLKDGLKAKISKPQVEHLSIFAIGPIPLLVSLGASIGRALPADYFHFHSARQSWSWPNTGTKIEFKASLIRKGASKEVAVLVSCSGTIKPEDVEKHIGKDTWVYHIHPSTIEPRPDLIDHPESVASFVETYNGLKADLKRDVTSLSKIHLFHASPPSIAIASGQHLFSKVDPPVLVYDYRKVESSFVPILEVNQ